MTQKLFTAPQLARALRTSRQVVYARAGHIAPENHAGDADAAAAAWAFADLPMDWQLEITRRGVKRGFANGEEFLAAAREPWKCPVAWPDIPRKRRDKAVQLQKALARPLAMLADQNTTAGQVEEIGLADFVAEFSYRISARHWRRLLQRTLDRDRGDENWQRLEIYLDDRALSVPVPALARELSAGETAHQDLDWVISKLENRQSPTEKDREFFWRHVAIHYDELTVHLADSPLGKSERRSIRASLASYLLNAFPPGTLCATAKSLRNRLSENLSRGKPGRRVPGDFKCRRDNCGRKAKRLCEDCRKKLKGLAVDLDKDISQAWRRLHFGKQPAERFCDRCLSLWKFNVRSNKSYVPQSVREDVMPGVHIAWVQRRGAKYARLISPSIKRDWSDTGPGAYSVMDDMTPDHAVFGSVELPLAYNDQPSGGQVVGRMEALFSVDARTDYPLAFLLILGDPATLDSPQRKATYNQVHQRLLLLRQHDSIGMPHLGLHLENGPWKNYLMDPDPVKSWRTLGVPQFETGLGAMDIQIRRALPGNPRSKIIERVFHAVQSRMRCQPGFLGNNERMDKREAVQDFISRVKRGKEHAGNELLHVSDYKKLLGDEFMAFAEEPQNGDRLPGVSPKEAFYNGIDGHPGHNSKPMREFRESGRFHLATHEKPLFVSLQGIRFPLGKSKYSFWGPELEPYQNQWILARFNVEEPGLLSCRPEGGEPFTVKERILPANTATKEQLQDAARARASWMRRGKVLFDSLPHPFRFKIARDSAPGEETRKFGEQYEKELAAFKAEKSTKGRKLTKLREKAAAAGIELPAHVRNADDVAEAIERREFYRKRMVEEEAQSTPRLPANSVNEKVQ